MSKFRGAVAHAHTHTDGDNTVDSESVGVFCLFCCRPGVESVMLLSWVALTSNVEVGDSRITSVEIDEEFASLNSGSGDIVLAWSSSDGASSASRGLFRIAVSGFG